jgi:biotin carboxylase
VKTVLFVGAARDQARALERARELGVRVLAVEAADVDRVEELGRTHDVDGLLAGAAAGVFLVAAAAEELGLPGMGRATAHLLTHRVAMRRRLAEQGIAQPEFAAVRTLHEARVAVHAIGLPAILKPADAAGQRGVFLLRYTDEVETHLHAALAESPTQEAIVERYHDGLLLTAVAIARGGHVTTLAASDRLRPPGGFAVYPTKLFGDALAEAEDTVVRAVHALDLRDGIASAQLLATEEDMRVLELTSGIPGDDVALLALHTVGVDLVEVALRQALGESVPDELVTPRFQRPLAIGFLTAEPGPLPAGRVRRVGSLEKVLAFPGVVDADTSLAAGETIDPVRLNGERRGYVIATGATNIEALERAEAAARLVDVEVW